MGWVSEPIVLGPIFPLINVVFGVAAAWHADALGMLTRGGVLSALKPSAELGV